MMSMCLWTLVRRVQVCDIHTNSHPLDLSHTHSLTLPYFLPPPPYPLTPRHIFSHPPPPHIFSHPPPHIFSHPPLTYSLTPPSHIFSPPLTHSLTPPHIFSHPPYICPFLPHPLIQYRKATVVLDLAIAHMQHHRLLHAFTHFKRRVAHTVFITILQKQTTQDMACFRVQETMRRFRRRVGQIVFLSVLRKHATKAYLLRMVDKSFAHWRYIGRFNSILTYLYSTYLYSTLYLNPV